MTLTLLLDLDDTLLENSADLFVKAYLQKLGTFLNKVTGISPEVIIQNLLMATRGMIHNRLPDHTLKEVFDAAFYPTLGFEEQDLRPHLEEFYRVIYPSLRTMTHPAEGAQELVNSAVERGWRIAIATNPLFPVTAVRQRLDWAGFQQEKYPFDLVGSYENFHFAKPNPAYYSEILAKLGKPEEPALMVGNDPDEDILPARDAGLATYQVIKNESGDSARWDGPSAAGTLKQLHQWITSVDPESLCPSYNSIQAILAQLYATPAGLLELVRNLPDTQLTRRPDLDEWSLTEIFCHLRDVECEVNIPRLELIRIEANPFISAQDTDRWAIQRDYFHQDGRRALREFTSARIHVLDILSRFTEDEWRRATRHAIFGPTSVQELFSFAATHDRLHIQQAHPLDA